MELLFIDYTLLKKERLETYHNIYYVNFYDLKYISNMNRYENKDRKRDYSLLIDENVIGNKIRKDTYVGYGLFMEYMNRNCFSMFIVHMYCLRNGSTKI